MRTKSVMAILLPTVCCAVSAFAGDVFLFKDVAREAGLLPHAAGIHGHAAGWGDVDGDDRPDLYIGTFHSPDTKPNMFFRQKGDRFALDTQEHLRFSGRPTGVVFVDFDNDGDLDLFVTSMPGTRQVTYDPCRLFRNEGEGRFSDVSKASGVSLPDFAARSACALDFNGDGLLDLAVGEDPLGVYSKTRRSRLFKNLGGFRFEDVWAKSGLPPDVPGLGVAAADVNNDTWPDLFLAARSGGNRLFLNDGTGRFREAPGHRKAFDWGLNQPKSEDTPCGVCLADLNRDGRLDIVVGQHFKRPWLEPVPVRLYLNEEIQAGVPSFKDVTEASGLMPLAMKAPHIEIQDFDNDGWPDLFVSIVKFAEGRPHPIIFRHEGLGEGTPRFSCAAWKVNDFPNAEERELRKTGSFFKAMVEGNRITYSAAAPCTDYDRDGRVDLFVANWWPERPSLLLHNESTAGHWLAVRVEGATGVNRQAIGARIQVFRPGHLGQPDALLGCRDISVGYGYGSGQEAIAHFGLGDEKTCDLLVVLPHGKGKIERRNVAADRYVTLQAER